MLENAGMSPNKEFKKFFIEELSDVQPCEDTIQPVFRLSLAQDYDYYESGDSIYFRFCDVFYKCLNNSENLDKFKESNHRNIAVSTILQNEFKLVLDRDGKYYSGINSIYFRMNNVIYRCPITAYNLDTFRDDNNFSRSRDYPLIDRNINIKSKVN